MIAVQVGSKATRDALFLDVFSAAHLPKAMLASALLSAAGVLLMSQGLAKLGPVRLVPALYLLSAAGFVGEWYLTAAHPKIATVVVYLHVAVLGSLLISGFWSVVTERFDPHTAKKVVGRITGGATVGGLIGGLVAERVAATVDVRSVLLVLAAMSVMCAVAIVQTGRGSPSRHADTGGGVAEGLRHFKQAPYLKMLALLVVLTALAGGVLDYAFKAEADAAYGSREALMSFFAIFYTATGVITVVAQTALSKQALERLGIGGTIALLPASVMLGGVVGASFTRLWTVVAARGVEYVLSNSLYQSGYQLLFTPLSPEKKRPTKAVIDVGFDRLGTAVGSGMVLLMVAFAAEYATVGALAIAAVASLLALVVALRLHRGYVQQLAASLRSGRLKLSERDVVDATTRRTLAETTMALDREQLLAEIETLRTKRSPRGASTGDAQSSTAQSSTEPRSTEPIDPSLVLSPRLREAIDDVSSGELRRMRKALSAPLQPELVGFVIPLLGSEVLGRMARRALREAAARSLGQLVDAMLDPDQATAVRRRLPAIIKTVRNSRAAAGLMAALAVTETQVQERAAAALVEMVRADNTLAPPADIVFAAVERELRREQVSLPRVFVFLELALEPEPLRLALSALRSKDTNLRGTSYEYLENVLPEALRAALWPHFEAYASSETIAETIAETRSETPSIAAPDAAPEAAPEAAPQAGPEAGPEAAPEVGPERTREQLVDALKQSSDTLEVDPGYS